MTLNNEKDENDIILNHWFMSQSGGGGHFLFVGSYQLVLWNRVDSHGLWEAGTAELKVWGADCFS